MKMNWATALEFLLIIKNGSFESMYYNVLHSYIIYIRLMAQTKTGNH